MVLKILPKYKNYELKIFDKTGTDGIYKNPPHTNIIIRVKLILITLL